MQAKVVEGRKIGRTLGFPTANLEFLNPQDMPSSGVYVVDVTVDGREFKGMLNVGVRPTFGDSERLAEVHLLDFDEPIYGKILEIELVRFLREERTFATVEELIAQLNVDKKKTAQKRQSF